MKTEKKNSFAKLNFLIYTTIFKPREQIFAAFAETTSRQKDAAPDKS